MSFRIMLAPLSAAMLFCAAGNAATLTYDALGRVASVTYDDGKSVAYTYDPAGNRTQHVVTASTNLPPVAVDDEAGLDVALVISALIDVKANDTDPNGHSLTVVATSNSASGMVLIVNGGALVQYIYTGPTPIYGQTLSDSFTYTVSDGNGGTDEGLVTVTVENSQCPGFCDPTPP